MMTITLPEEIELRLKDEAAKRGLNAAEYATRIIETALPKSAADPTIALLEQLDKEDATDDPAELARREEEGHEFMQSLNRTRLETEGPNARRIWP